MWSKIRIYMNVCTGLPTVRQTLTDKELSADKMVEEACTELTRLLAARVFSNKGKSLCGQGMYSLGMICSAYYMIILRKLT